jgi:cell division transport system permease protein
MLFYYLKETINSLLNSKLGSLLIIITTAIAIIFVSLSAGLIIFSSTINNKLKDNIRISLFINDSVSGTGFSKIERELSDNEFVESFNLISKSEALRIMNEKTGEDFLSVLEANPLPASYVVKLYSDSVSTFSIDPIISNLKKTAGVDEVVYDYRLTLKILNFINSSKQIIYGASIFLFLLSIYLVYSNNKLLISSRINKYNTMKLVGAKLRTIKIPIFLNGIIMGLIASLICLTIFYFTYTFASKLYNLSQFELNPYYLLTFIIILGMFLGLLGSYLATLNVSLKINKRK